MFSRHSGLMCSALRLRKAWGFHLDRTVYVMKLGFAGINSMYFRKFFECSNKIIILSCFIIIGVNRLHSVYSCRIKRKHSQNTETVEFCKFSEMYAFQGGGGR